jgi:hypothetical protein
MRNEIDAGGFGSAMMALAVDFVFGSIWTRPGLDRKQRSLVTLGILIALRRTEELKNHAHGSLPFNRADRPLSRFVDRWHLWWHANLQIASFCFSLPPCSSDFVKQGARTAYLAACSNTGSVFRKPISTPPRACAWSAAVGIGSATTALKSRYRPRKVLPQYGEAVPAGAFSRAGKRPAWTGDGVWLRRVLPSQRNGCS